MKFLLGIILTVLLVTLSKVFAIEDRHRHRHGHGRRHRHGHGHGHHRHNSDDEEADGGWTDKEENKYSSSVHKKCKRSGQVALTFDDGVVEETSQILDILERHGVKATFFVVGHTIEGNPMYHKVLKRILDDGHTLGTHTYSHADLTSLGAEGIKYELEKAGDIIQKSSGERPKILRPPYGSVGAEMLRIAGDIGYEVVNWNVDTNDWRTPYDTTPIINALYENDYTGHDGNDSKIVLMHDRPVTVNALNAVIKFYKKKGIEFVNMERCLGPPVPISSKESFPRMPRGFRVLTAQKCPHFDITKSPFPETFLAAFKKIKFANTLETLKPSAKAGLNKMAGLKVGEAEDEKFKCFQCNLERTEVLGTFYCCLNCSVVGCWTSENSPSCHIKSHLNDSHPIGMELSTGTIYCNVCNLFIWNATMDLLTKCPDVVETGKATNSSPTKKKKSAAKESAKIIVSDNLRKHCVSMRGMVNLGNTCFMASILQVLLHTRQLRNFFMSGEHNSKMCSRRIQKSTNNVCMACELDDLFRSNYCGEIVPLAPTEFLHAVWRSAKNLSGYEQQDAHEFLISVLGQVHTDLGGSTFACKCPVHSSFTGVLQSDVTCLSCGNVNASFDPFIDISLDILGSSSKDSSFMILDPNTSTLNLHECFQMFTHAEKLSSNTYMCASCNHSYQEASKQLSIRKAPEILTINLKRFEHSLNTIKIDTFMQFPLEFSIFDYTTEGVHLRNELMKIGSGEMNANVIDPGYEGKKYSKEMLYKLVATVNHTGVVDSGHYVAYIASSDQSSWFKFDDAMVTKVPSGNVLNSNAYMLFYERIGEFPTQNQDDLLEA